MQKFPTTKDEAILYIEGLYPPDADNTLTAEIGEQLLKQAKMEIEGWRSESEAVLIRFAHLCIYHNARS